MKRLQILLTVALLSVFFGANAAPPIEYNASVRNDKGHVMANMPVRFKLEIVDSAMDGTLLYSEIQTLVTDERGMAGIMVGEGTPTEGEYDLIDWSEPRFLTVKIDPENSGTYRSLGTMQLLGAPKALRAATATSLVRTSRTGETLELSVDNTGTLKWEIKEESDTPNYDQNKVPEKLYFIGDFNNWKVEEAVEMTKLSDTKFSIDRNLSRGEIFKFVPQQQWTTLDWSGTDIVIGEPVPLKELGNTPAFYGQPGEYTITIDFYKFTMLITKK